MYSTPSHARRTSERELRNRRGFPGLDAKMEGTVLVVPQVQGQEFACVIHTSCPLRLHNKQMPGLTHDHNTTTPRTSLLHSARSSLQQHYFINPSADHLTRSSTQQNFTMAIGIFTILAGLLAVTAAYFYFFGISPETKRKMEQQALKTMGENKMSYMAKGE
jgi:hypothetical protein